MIAGSIRPEVQWFAEQLELELRKGDDGGPYTDWWIGHSEVVLMRKMRAALVELEAAMLHAGHENSDARRLAIIDAAAKSASFLVMLASEWRPFPRDFAPTISVGPSDATCWRGRKILQDFSVEQPCSRGGVCSEGGTQ